MVEFSIFNKNVPVAPKPKGGRKSKAAKALERNVDLNYFYNFFYFGLNKFLLS